MISKLGRIEIGPVEDAEANHGDRTRTAHRRAVTAGAAVLVEDRAETGDVLERLLEGRLALLETLDLRMGQSDKWLAWRRLQGHITDALFVDLVASLVGTAVRDTVLDEPRGRDFLVVVRLTREVAHLCLGGWCADDESTHHEHADKDETNQPCLGGHKHSSVRSRTERILN